MVSTALHSVDLSLLAALGNRPSVSWMRTLKRQYMGPRCWTRCVPGQAVLGSPVVRSGVESGAGVLFKGQFCSWGLSKPGCLTLSLSHCE